MAMRGYSSLKGQGAPSALEDIERVEVWSIPEIHCPGGAAPSDSGPLRVLLAEDNSIDQIYIRTLLERQCFEVTCATNGKEAVALFDAGRYDIVLMDILMPEMDGFEATSIIREKERPHGRTPVIALTAYSLRTVLDKCKGVGMNGYLSKPVSANDLVELLSRLCGKDSIGKERGHGGTTANPELLPVLDVNSSLGLLGGDRGFYREIMAIFAGSAPKIIRELVAALKTEDHRRVEFYAHNLNGMSANIGAKRLAELARTIHNNVRRAVHADIELWKARLPEEFEAVTAAVARTEKGILSVEGDVPIPGIDHGKAS